MLGVVKLALGCPATAVPPVATVYQRYCPALPPDAVKVSVPLPQMLAPVAVGAVGKLLIVAMTGVRALSQVPLSIATK
jgi:hypothetical protein